MNKTMKFSAFGLALLSAFLALPVNAQNRVAFGGAKNAVDYAYGNVIGAPALTVGLGPVLAGTNVTITLSFGNVSLADGTTFMPLATNAPIYLGSGASQEKVTPSAVNCITPTIYNSCTFTVTTSNQHGTGDPVASATFGLQEAINAAKAAGGGTVLLSPAWNSSGGTTAMITAAAPYSNVYLTDNRGLQLATSINWTMQPNTLTVLTVPSTLTATNIVFTAATGTWAASSTHFLATCVDALGGESAVSLDYTQTPTLNYTLTVPVPPTCATGAVGWRLYAGTGSSALTYLLPITSANCTLSTLVSTINACALTATGTWATTFTSTTSLSPVALGVTNTNNPVPQSHQTFAYQPTAGSPVPFQTHYGPFGSGTIASATASDLTILGSIQLPPGYLNYIGRTIRISGKIKLTAGASSTLSIQVGMSWAGGLTAGLPITVGNAVSGFVFATQPYTDISFTCTMVTNAVGATAIGTIQPDSTFVAGYAAGTLIPVATDTSAVAIGSLGLFSQDTLSISILPLVAADTTVQLMALNVDTLQ